MLSFEEFMDKSVIILDKFQYVYVMVDESLYWTVVSISKNSEHDVCKECLQDEEAYEFYRERMESYGYKPFPIIME